MYKYLCRRNRANEAKIQSHTKLGEERPRSRTWTESAGESDDSLTTGYEAQVHAPWPT